MAIGMFAAAAGAQVLGGLINAYNAEKARGADKRKLKEIRDLFEKIKPPDYDVSIDAPPQYHEQVLAQPKYSDPLAPPAFDTSKLKPEDLKVVGKYTPEIAPYIAEQNPELVRQSAAAMEGREAQKKALQTFLKMGETGDDAISAQAAFEAREKAAADTRARQQALEQSFARRGQLGSGMQFAAGLQSGQAAGNQQALAQMQAASDAQRRRLQALSSGAALGSEIYGQEMNLAGQNAAIINDFNRRMAQSRQAYEMSRAGTLNEAQRYNLGTAQDVEARNVASRNAAQAANLQRADMITRYGAEFGRAERDRQDRIAREGYDIARSERDFQNQIAQNKADWAARQRQIRNQLMGQTYRDQMAQARGMSGVIGDEREASQQAARDRAQMVQGMANIGSSYAAGRQARSDWAQQQAAEDERWGVTHPGQRRRQYESYYNDDWGDY